MKLCSIIILTAFAACISRTANANPTHENTMNEATKTVSEPVGASTFTAANIAKFWARVDKRGPDDCWLWTGATQRSTGYGKLSTRRSHSVSAHRISFEIHHGEIPDLGGSHGGCVLHKCDNRICVNPAHLFLGTQLENIKDMVSKGRSAKGKDHSHAKLNDEQVREMRRIFAETRITYNALGKRFSVNQSCAYKIVHRIHWKHLT